MPRTFPGSRAARSWTPCSRLCTICGHSLGAHLVQHGAEDLHVMCASAEREPIGDVGEVAVHAWTSGAAVEQGELTDSGGSLADQMKHRSDVVCRSGPVSADRPVGFVGEDRPAAPLYGAEHSAHLADDRVRGALGAGGGGPVSADRPGGFVGEDRPAAPLYGAGLSAHLADELVRGALGVGGALFAGADERGEPGGYGGRGFRGHDRVGVTEAAPLRM